MDRRRIEELIAQLEQQRSRLEVVRRRAQRQGGPEGERLEKQAESGCGTAKVGSTLLRCKRGGGNFLVDAHHQERLLPAP